MNHVEPEPAPGLQILPVHGIPELRPGDDLTAAIATAAPWMQDGDVVVVTSKAVSKVEGRLWPAGPGEREAVRQRAIDAETVRVVASRGTTRIVQNRQGFVVAAAGVDASNVRTDEIALLPVDPDTSARTLRDGLARALGVRVAVVVSDTAGRPWRTGVTDYAVGAAGIGALHSLRGAVDAMGNELVVTEVAVVDELAAAADLVKGKLSGIPVAIVRGLAFAADERGVRPLVRSCEHDLFRLGTTEALAEGRRQALAPRPVVREITDKPVEPQALERALAAAAAGVPQGQDPGWRLVLLESAPVRLVPCLVRPDTALGLGGAVERLLISLYGDGLHAAWLPLPELDLAPELRPVGLLAIGYPVQAGDPAPADPAAIVVRR